MNGNQIHRAAQNQMTPRLLFRESNLGNKVFNKIRLHRLTTDQKWIIRPWRHAVSDSLICFSFRFSSAFTLFFIFFNNLHFNLIIYFLIFFFIQSVYKKFTTTISDVTVIYKWYPLVFKNNLFAFSKCAT